LIDRLIENQSEIFKFVNFTFVSDFARACVQLSSAWFVLYIVQLQSYVDRVRNLLLSAS